MQTVFQPSRLERFLELSVLTVQWMLPFDGLCRRWSCNVELSFRLLVHTGLLFVQRAAWNSWYPCLPQWWCRLLRAWPTNNWRLWSKKSIFLSWRVKLGQERQVRKLRVASADFFMKKWKTHNTASLWIPFKLQVIWKAGRGLRIVIRLEPSSSCGFDVCRVFWSSLQFFRNAVLQVLWRVGQELTMVERGCLIVWVDGLEENGRLIEQMTPSAAAQIHPVTTAVTLTLGNFVRLPVEYWTTSF